MTTWVLAPVKAPQDCKTRLSPALDAAARQALVEGMLRHVVETAASVDGVDEVVLLGPSRHGLSPALRRLEDPGGGLNAALTAGLAAALDAGVERLVILPADLPQLSRADVAALATLPPATLGLAPDRKAGGTNALSLPAERAAGFRFQFGPDSFDRHRREAERLGLTLAVVRSETLGLDIDEPEDLSALRPA